MAGLVQSPSPANVRSFADTNRISREGVWLVMGGAEQVVSKDRGPLLGELRHSRKILEQFAQMTESDTI